MREEKLGDMKMRKRWSVKPSKQVPALLVLSLLIILAVYQTPASAIDSIPSDRMLTRFIIKHNLKIQTWEGW